MKLFFLTGSGLAWKGSGSHKLYSVLSPAPCSFPGPQTTCLAAPFLPTLAAERQGPLATGTAANRDRLLSVWPDCAAQGRDRPTFPRRKESAATHNRCDLYSKATYICFYPLNESFFDWCNFNSGARYSPENTMLLLNVIVVFKHKHI